jgi:outer membrane murein-binding lipoprotein Lpp
MKRIYITIFAAVALILPVIAGAQTADIASLQAQIKTLLLQIQTLQQQLNAQQQAVRETRSELRGAVQELRAQLRQGSTSDEVLLLQELLATDFAIYPEGLVTGFFGPLTRQAVIRFQIKHGIEGVGEVGPQTRRALNAFLKKNTRPDKITDKLLTKFKGDNEDENDDEIRDEDDEINGEPANNGHGRRKEKIRICHMPPGNPLAAHTIIIAAPALNAHMGHGDALDSCKNNDDDDSDQTDITAPVISHIVATSTRATTTHITWNTNEQADSAVWYGTTTPLGITTDYKARSTILVTSHDLLLSGLATSTQYYYFAVSMDSVGNTATSSEQTFVTVSE